MAYRDFPFSNVRRESNELDDEKTRWASYAHHVGYYSVYTLAYTHIIYSSEIQKKYIYIQPHCV